MKRYLAIYRQLIRLNLSALLTYRINFVNNLLASIGWGATSLLTVYLLTAKITGAYGWKREELLLFNGIYGVVIGLFHMFISVNMGRLSRVIHMGELDAILVKPLDSQFAVSLWQINFATVARILMAALFSVWVIGSLGVTVTAEAAAAFVLLSGATLLLLYSLWFLILTNLIWFTNLSNLVLFMYSFESMARFPKEMLMQLSSVLFVTVFPLAIAVNTPARALIGKMNVTDSLLLLLLSVAFFAASRAYWKFALRYYTSASG